MKKAVIFDLDGTLANTLASLAHCTNRVLEDFGFLPLEPSVYARFVGNGARMQMTRALRAAGDKESDPKENFVDEDGRRTEPLHLEAAYARYMEYFAEDCTYQVRPYEGIPQLIEALQKEEIRMAVLSNKPHGNTKRVMEALGLDAYFDQICGQRPKIPKKPAPDGVFEILRQWNLPKEDVLYVGDSSVDMDTGKAAGLYTVGVLWGFRGKEELKAHGVDRLIDSPMQLLECL